MASPASLLDVRGDNQALIDLLKDPLNRALEGRQSRYEVRVEAVGRVGEVLVSITGSNGRLPLLFGHEELEPGYVSRVVQAAVERFAF